MQNISLYDLDLNYITETHFTTSMQWHLRYNASNDGNIFEFHIDKDNAFAVEVMANRDKELLLIQGDKIGYIDTISDIDGSFAIFGYTIEWLISTRTTAPLNFASKTPQFVINSLVTTVFPELEYVNLTTTNIPVFNYAKVDREITSSIVVDICSKYNLGWKIQINWTTNKFMFILYEGKSRIAGTTEPLIISKQDKTIDEYTYTQERRDYRSEGWYKLAGVWTKYTKTTETGLHIRDCILTDTETEKAKESLAKQKMNETIKGTIAEFLLFGVDYGLGDLITFQLSQGTKDLRITGVNEVYEYNNTFVEPVFEGE